jgi:hypothetical protein
MDLTKCAWPGGSGRTYEFQVYPISVTVNPGYEGNYIFAKMVNNSWHAVYIGEGILKDRVECHRNDAIVLRKGATHLHLRVDANYSNRFAVESDLLAGNPEAYDPNGCNVKKGG